MSKIYKLVWEGHVREVYEVEADSEKEALEKWADETPVSSEAYDGEIVEVTVDED